MTGQRDEDHEAGKRNRHRDSTTLSHRSPQKWLSTSQKRKERVHAHALLRAPSLAVLDVCVGAIAARAHRTALAHGSFEAAQVLSSMVPCWHSVSTHCVSLYLSHGCDFSACAFPQSRAAADQYASLLSTPARFTAT